MGIEVALKSILEWADKHLVLLVFVLTFVIQITPIKFNPWSTLFKWIGKIINEDTDKKINSIVKTTDQLKKEIQLLQENVDENEKDRIRWEVLNFANSCRHGQKHTEDEFKHIIAVNDKYHDLLAKTDDKNGVFDAEYEYIYELYKQKDFLKGE